MGHGSIERELHVEAAPEVVFDVLSRPEHLRERWPDEAELPAGEAGRIGLGPPGPDRRAPDPHISDRHRETGSSSTGNQRYLTDHCCPGS